MCLWCLDRLLLGIVIRMKTLSKYNILKENDLAKCQLGQPLIVHESPLLLAETEQGN